MNIKDILDYLDNQGIIIIDSDGELQDTLEEIGYSLFTQIEEPLEGDEE